MTTHIERTAKEVRQAGIHAVTLARIQRVSPTVRLLTLALPYAVKFLPGQWVDLHIPSLPSPGGFTITSSPSLAELGGEPRPSAAGGEPSSPSDEGRARLLAALQRPAGAEGGGEVWGQRPRGAQLELAVQRTGNAPARWLWRAGEEIVGTELAVRIGGSFVWPPAAEAAAAPVENVVFVAGGVGVNPFVAMLSRMYEDPDSLPRRITLLYGARAAPALHEVLFLDRLASLFDGRGAVAPSPRRRLRLYLTGELAPAVRSLLPGSGSVEILAGRMPQADVLEAAGAGESAGDGSVAYVCGPGGFVDDTVGLLSSRLGERNVFYERWW